MQETEIEALYVVKARASEPSHNAGFRERETNEGKRKETRNPAATRLPGGRGQDQAHHPPHLSRGSVPTPLENTSQPGHRTFLLMKSQLGTEPIPELSLPDPALQHGSFSSAQDPSGLYALT